MKRAERLDGEQVGDMDATGFGQAATRRDCSTSHNSSADPVLNGGGALMDFGCYGADLITWLMDGQRPTSVTAVTQQLKPEVYPRVDDDATIILSYPHTQGVIQASWNWPIGRKDMDIYGVTGQVAFDEVF